MRQLRLSVLIAALVYVCLSAGSVYDFYAGLLDGWACGNGARMHCPY